MHNRIPNVEEWFCIFCHRKKVQNKSKIATGVQQQQCSREQKIRKGKQTCEVSCNLEIQTSNKIMATVDLVMPKMGERIMEATILTWHKQPGDSVKMDETVLEIATDKVDSEVPSTAEGVIEELLYNVNDVVPIGTVIARIKTGAAQENQSATGNGQPSGVQQVTPA